MLSQATERRIDKMIAIAEELGAIFPLQGWTEYTTRLLAELQELAIKEFSGREAERMDASLADIEWKVSEPKFKPADDLTDEEKAQGFYFRTVNGNSIKFNSETGEPMEGQPKAFGANDLSEMVRNAKAALEAKKDRDTASSAPKSTKNVSDHYSSPYPIEEISAEGENHPCKGFKESNLRLHKDVRHKKQYEKMTDAEYEEHAKKLLAKKCGPDIWGYRSADGSVCRFNRLTGEFAKGYPGGDIKTCFYPVALGADPLDIDLEYARNYFRKRKEEESYDR